MKKIIALLILATTFKTWANSPGLPDNRFLMSIDTVAMYLSPIEMSWLEPFAFKPKFSCIKSSGSGLQTCRVEIFNSFSADDQAVIQSFQNMGYKVAPFSHLNSNIITNINESLELNDSGIKGSSILPGTLYLNPDHLSYASFLFRVPADKAAQMEIDFANSGIGSFKVSYRLNQQKTETLLAIRNGKCLREKLMRANSEAISRKELRSLLNDIHQNCDIVSEEYTHDEARTTLRVYLIDTFFEWSHWKWGYVLKNTVSEIPDSGVVYDHTMVAPLVSNCTVTLNLKDNATPVKHCR